MCGRIFQIYLVPELSDRYLDGEEDPSIEFTPSYNLCPTENSPILRWSDGKRRIDSMRWQLVPKTEPTFSTKLSTINARSESVFSSSLYRDLIVGQRCIVPISGFYEWKREGKSSRPFKVVLRDEAIASVAGIWDVWRDGKKEERYSFSILTTAANEIISSIHTRMPVFLDRSDENAWLDPSIRERETLQKILKPCPSSWVEATEVSPLVNSPKNNSEELLRPVKSGAAAERRAPTLFEL